MTKQEALKLRDVLIVVAYKVKKDDPHLFEQIMQVVRAIEGGLKL